MSKEKKEKKKDEKKKKKHSGKIIFIFILIVVTILGGFLGYSIYKNGGGLQGILATVLGQDAEKLENLEPMNVLLLRSK